MEDEFLNHPFTVDGSECFKYGILTPGQSQGLGLAQGAVVNAHFVDDTVEVINLPSVAPDLEGIGVRGVEGLLPVDDHAPVRIDPGVRAVVDMGEVHPLVGRVIGEVIAAAPVLDPPADLDAVQRPQGEVLGSDAITVYPAAARSGVAVMPLKARLTPPTAPSRMRTTAAAPQTA